jgi:hypothetical protein
MALISYNTADGAVREEIDFAGDYDVYQVELIGGNDYLTTAIGGNGEGGTLPDPYIQIYDSESGELLYQLDDSTISGVDSTLVSMIDLPDSGLGITSYDPSFTFQAPYSGSYDVVVGGVGESSGSYTFDLDNAGVPISLVGE